MVPTIHGKGVIVAQMLDGHLLVGPTAEDNVPKEKTRLVTPALYEKIRQIGAKIIPNLKMEKTCQTFAESRPIEPLSKDFYLKAAHNNPKFINVAGTKSPGLSGAPAIAKYICHLLTNDSCQLVKNQDFFRLPDFYPIQLEIISTI